MNNKFSKNNENSFEKDISSNSLNLKDDEKKAIELIRSGRLEDAARVYSQLIEAGSKNYIVYGNLAALMIKSKNRSINQIIKLLNISLNLNPKFSDGYNNLGNILKEKGDLDSSINAYLNAIDINPSYPEAHFNLGNAYRDKGNIEKAINAFQASINLRPNYPKAYNNLGKLLIEFGELDQAIYYIEKALYYSPRYVEALTNLGLIYYKKDNFPTALKVYKNVISISPEYFDAHNNLGILYQRIGNLKSAIKSFEKALNFNPKGADTFNNLGFALLESDDINQSICMFRKAIKLRSIFPEAYSNLGNALKEKGDLESAISSYKKAIQLNSSFAEAHWNLSLVQLLTGDYDSGWDSYQWRTKKKDPKLPHCKPQTNEWDGGELEKNEKLLIISEQGLGDTIQYMRYIPYLKSIHINLSFCTLTKLHSIVQSSKIDQTPLSPEQGEQVKEGKWISLLSLPRLLRITPTNPIVLEPYISSTSELKKNWRDKLRRGDKDMIVGLNWQGNPEMEKTHKGRSISLETFKILSEIDNIQLLSLQKGFGSEQLKSCSFKDKFVKCQNEIDHVWDFNETAAIIDNCDLIITSDTAVAHLAGGMGKNVWLLLKDVPYWTWGMNSERTFWYPSMILFRQKIRHDWTEVMNRVAVQLKKFQIHTE